MKLIRSFASIGGFTIASRIVGFLRELLMANFLGAGATGDAFLVALKLPSFLRRILAEGAFNTAFVPIFGGVLVEKGQEKAKAFASEILTLFVIFLTVLVAAAHVAMPHILPFFAPGFKSNPEQLALAVSLTRITFPFILFISLTALYSSILNSFERFAAVASSPMAGNVMIIMVAFALIHFFDVPGADSFAWGVLACGVTQFIWVAHPAGRLQMGLRFTLGALSQEARRFFRLLLPVAFGTGVVHISLYIDVMIASLLPSGSISYIHYADRLNQLPLSVLGTAIGTALLPLLSKQLKKGDMDGATTSQNLALEYALLFTVPATIILMIFARSLIQIAFESGQFSSADTLQTGYALTALAAGLPAYVLIKVLTTSFFARQNTLTPIVCASVSVVFNILGSLALMKYYGHVGICMAAALSSWLNIALLVHRLWRGGLWAPNGRFRLFWPRLVMASVLMAVFLLLIKPWIDTQMISPHLTTRFWAGLLLGIASIGSFIGFARLTKALDFKDLRYQLQKKETDDGSLQSVGVLKPT